MTLIYPLQHRSSVMGLRCTWLREAVLESDGERAVAVTRIVSLASLAARLKGMCALKSSMYCSVYKRAQGIIISFSSAPHIQLSLESLVTTHKKKEEER